MTGLFDVLLGAVLVLAMRWLWKRRMGFLAQRPGDYASLSPAFDMPTYLNGKMDCDGAIYGPTGRVAARFNGRFEVLWDGPTGTMTEHFTYDSGTVQHRQWTLVLGEDGRFTATAPDVLGTGQGQIAGSALRLVYRLKLPEGGGGHVVNVTDWMYITPDGNIVNRSQFRKFGLVVGELVATLRPTG